MMYMYNDMLKNHNWVDDNDWLILDDSYKTKNTNEMLNNHDVMRKRWLWYSKLSKNKTKTCILKFSWK